MTSSTDYQLGQIAARLDAIESGQGEIKQTLTSIDGRLRHVEARSAVAGTVAGGVVSVGVALVAGMLKGGGA